MMRSIKTIIVISFALFMISCDPIHDLKLENRSSNAIEIIYYPNLEKRQILDKRVEKIEIDGREMSRIMLDSAEAIHIGTVVARYNPSVKDIDLNYLEVRYGLDTFKLSGKSAILSTIQKVEKLDWRIIIR